MARYFATSPGLGLADHAVRRPGNVGRQSRTRTKGMVTEPARSYRLSDILCLDSMVRNRGTVMQQPLAQRVTFS